MKISGGLRPISELRRRHPDFNEAAPQPTLATALAMRPSTDEARLNKTECAWLEVLRGRGYDWIGVQNITLKIGDDCRYTPDFCTLGQGVLIAWETKGFMREDALVKVKAAARMFAWLQIVKVERVKGVWIETPIKP